MSNTIDTIIQKLFSKQDTTGNTALMLAVMKGDLAVVSKVLQHPTEFQEQLTMKNNNGLTAFLLAVLYNRTEMIHELLQPCSALRSQDYATIFTATNNRGYNMLMLAVENGQLEIVELLLSLQCRQRLGSALFATMLLQTDRQIASTKQTTTLDAATAAHDGYNAFMIAADYDGLKYRNDQGNLTILRHFLALRQQGLLNDTSYHQMILQTSRGYNAFTRAVINGNAMAVQLLLTSSELLGKELFESFIYIQDNYGRNALALAVAEDRTTVVGALINYAIATQNKRFIEQMFGPHQQLLTSAKTPEIEALLSSFYGQQHPIVPGGA